MDMPRSNGLPVEVLGVERRRRWSREAKAAMVAETYEPGASGPLGGTAAFDLGRSKERASAVAGLGEAHDFPRPVQPDRFGGGHARKAGHQV